MTEVGGLLSFVRLTLRVAMHNDENVVGVILLYNSPYTRHESVHM